MDGEHFNEFSQLDLVLGFLGLGLTIFVAWFPARSMTGSISMEYTAIKTFEREMEPEYGLLGD